MQRIMQDVHMDATEHGFWPKGRLELCHERKAAWNALGSEFMELCRSQAPWESAKIRGFNQCEEEAADVVIMLMSMAQQFGWKLPEAILAKAKYNISRPWMHQGEGESSHGDHRESKDAELDYSFKGEF